MNSFAQMYKDDKLLVYRSELKYVETVEYYLVFENNTNYTMRVNFEAKYRFVHYNPNQDFSRQETIIIKPQGTYSWFPSEKHPEPGLALKSSTIIVDFKLINYSVKKEEYEVPW